MTWKPAQRAPVGQIWVNLDRKRKIMIYKTLNKKGSLQFIVTFSNKKRREKPIIMAGCQPINVEEIAELENHYFSNTSFIIVSGKDDRCLVKPLGASLVLTNKVFTQSQGS